VIGPAPSRRGYKGSSGLWNGVFGLFGWCFALHSRLERLVFVGIFVLCIRFSDGNLDSCECIVYSDF
jgi:hypothetical protein